MSAGSSGAAAHSASGDVDPRIGEETTEEEEKDNYVVGRQRTLKEQMEADASDESLNKWKRALLGNASASTAMRASVSIEQVRFTFVEANKVFVLDCATEAQRAALKTRKLVFREGETYQSSVTFRVRDNIVSGFKCRKVAKRGPFSAKGVEMMGSFGPQETPHVFALEASEVPSGMLKRGNYSATMEFLDDDNLVHGAIEYQVEVAKNWE